MSSRAVASFIRIGMLTPATTSTRPGDCRATATLWLVAVSPSMSVRMSTPEPLSTRAIAARMRAAMSSGGSPASVTTASIASTGPSTLSSAWTISAPRRPWPTTTIPTIPAKTLPSPRGGEQAAAARAAALALDVAMAHEDVLPGLLEPAAQLLDQHHRAMAPPRAAERDREVALPLALVARQREQQQGVDAVEELLRVVAPQHPVCDARVEPGTVPQLLDEEGVGEEPAVDHEVGVARQAVLVAEGDQSHRHRARVGTLDEVAQRRAQLVGGEGARVEDAIGDLAQGEQRVALAADAVGDRAALGGGVRAPGLAEAAHEHVVVGLEVEDLDDGARRAQLGEHAGEVEQEPPRAHVDAQRDAPDLLARALPQLEEARHQRHRQIVDAVEAEVLEHVQRGALARARHPRDHEHVQRAPHALRQLARRRRPLPAAARSTRSTNSRAL